MIGQIQSCFFSMSPVRETVRPIEVWPKVKWAWPRAFAAVERVRPHNRFSQFHMVSNVAIKKKNHRMRILPV
jgi:hypothetical protein